MKKVLCLAIALAASSISIPSFAGTISASATISAVADGANFDYTIHLTNTGSSSVPNTDSIQTFWYAWIPGQDYLPTSPSSIVAPAGWTDIITHAGNADGFAIQFKTSTAALAPGSSLDFKFSSIDTPVQLAGNSPFFPTTPVGTSFVYSGQPLQGDGLRFTVQSVPEPSSLVMGVLGAVGSLAGWRAQQRRIGRNLATRTA